MNHGEAVGLASTHDGVSHLHPEVVERVVRAYLEARAGTSFHEHVNTGSCAECSVAISSAALLADFSSVSPNVKA